MPILLKDTVHLFFQRSNKLVEHDDEHISIFKGQKWNLFISIWKGYCILNDFACVKKNIMTTVGCLSNYIIDLLYNQYCSLSLCVFVFNILANHASPVLLSRLCVGDRFFFHISIAMSAFSQELEIHCSLKANMTGLMTTILFYISEIHLV